MADQTFDPSKQFQEFVTSWERQIDKNANAMMGTELFSSWMNQMQQRQLAAQAAMQGYMGNQLAGMNMPSREDVVRLGEAVRLLDRRVERVESLLETLIEAQDNTRQIDTRQDHARQDNVPARIERPARTKRPLDAIVDDLPSLGNAA